MAHFDEKAGTVDCAAAWGQWHQTIDEVVLLVDVPAPTRGKQMTVDIHSRRISCHRDGAVLFEGELFSSVVVDDCVWTIEEQRLVRVVLSKSARTAADTWPSLFASGECAADAHVFDEMEKKMTLERFQRENPGFDFSGADMTGNYQAGGPQLPSAD